MLFINKYLFKEYKITSFDENYYYKKLFNFLFIIKYIILFILLLFLFYIRYIYININKNIFVEINNKFEIPLYEQNINFSTYSSKINPIAFYYPNFIYYDKMNHYFNNNICKNYIDNNILIINKTKAYLDILTKEVELAKSHGIYGFAIYYSLKDSQQINKILDILVNKKIYFPFLLIWENDIVGNLSNNTETNSLVNQSKYNTIIDLFINNIINYLKSDIYIKIKYLFFTITCLYIWI